MMRTLHRWLGIAVVLATVPNAPAQSRRAHDLAVGKLLVAPRNAADPNFTRTVILLAQYDAQGSMGLMVNRRTKIPISRALEDWKTAANKSDPIYMGGPVQLNGILALLRSSAKPADAPNVSGDIYLAASRAVMEKALTAGKGPAEFRVYLGYCGWGPGQLENEVDHNVWYIFSGKAGMAFDSDPASLWDRLIERTGQNVARVAGRQTPPPPEGTQSSVW